MVSAEKGLPESFDPGQHAAFTGEVDMATNYGLEPWEVEKGFVLACQSVPLTDESLLDYDKS